MHMVRKESEKEAERPHYYSQFWLDVAAGRKVIGGGLKTDEGETENDLDTAELEPQEPAMMRNSRNSTAAPIAQEEPVYTEPEDITEEFVAPEQEEAFPISEEEAFDHDQELPNILVDEEIEVPDMNLAEEEEEEDEFFDEEEDEEEDEDVEGWGRGRKKPKPGRQVKQPPKPAVKRPKRDRRF